MSRARYLLAGLAIGVVGGALVLGTFFVLAGPQLLEAQPEATSGFQSGEVASLVPASPSATSTFMPEPTSTTIQLPTVTPFPTQTPDALLLAINSGQLAFSGPLSNDQQVRLYAAALAYAQTTVAGSVTASKAINGVGYGDPSNICGPLAAAILRDAGLIPSDTVPHDFWLLDPRVPEDARKLERAFPPLKYDRWEISTALNKVDWKTNPLEPGDFLFIWHGSGGNFDHMLVVDRVDRNGRAYAVTNFGTAAGYIIAETMLYDPSDASQGIFHTWTEARDAILGSTGFGGYELWRLRGP